MLLHEQTPGVNRPRMAKVAAPLCAPVLRGRIDRDEAEELAVAFKAISDPARLLVLNFIALQASGEACVCHLTEPLGLSQPTVSHHLALLLRAGLLEREQRGTWAYYRIVPQRLEALRSALSPATGRRPLSRRRRA